MTFRDQLETDASIFVETDEFGETIEFTNTGSFPGASISAQVFRQARDSEQSDRNVVYSNRAIVFIRKADVTGQVDEKKSKLKMDLIEGDGAVVEWAVIEIRDRDDPALWRLVVVK